MFSNPLRKIFYIIHSPEVKTEVKHEIHRANGKDALNMTTTEDDDEKYHNPAIETLGRRRKLCRCFIINFSFSITSSAQGVESFRWSEGINMFREESKVHISTAFPRVNFSFCVFFSLHLPS